MDDIKIETKDCIINFNIDKITKEPYERQIEMFNKIDRVLLSINKSKYEHSKAVIEYIQSIKIPKLIKKEKITLFALLMFFQKNFVFKSITLNLSNFIKNSKYTTINIVSKLNNLPHLIGIKNIYDNHPDNIQKIRPKIFLEGVLHHWILIDTIKENEIDFEKLEVLPWIFQTLFNPTYIVDKNGINYKNTKIKADYIFIRKTNSAKYAFHIVAIKCEKDNTFALVSQFGIIYSRYYRIYKMFILDNALYSFKHPDKLGAGRVGSL